MHQSTPSLGTDLITAMQTHTTGMSSPEAASVGPSSVFSVLKTSSITAGTYVSFSFPSEILFMTGKLIKVLPGIAVIRWCSTEWCYQSAEIRAMNKMWTIWSDINKAFTKALVKMQLMERDAKTVGITSTHQLQGRRCSFMSHWEQCSAQYALLPDDETLSSPNPWVIRIGWSMNDP